MEDAVSNLTLVRHIYTTASQGKVIMAVEFDFAKDITEAVAEVKSAVDSIRNDLPPDLLEPQVSRLDLTSDNPTLTYAVSSATMSEEALSWYIDNALAKKLKTVRGVGEFTRLGGVTREVQVQVDPLKLNALGVTAVDISDTIKKIQQENSGGRGQLGGTEQGIRTIATMKTASDLEQLPIFLGNNAALQNEPLRLLQVASVVDTFAERTQVALLDGKPAIGFQILRAKGTDESRLASDIDALLKEIANENSDIYFQLIRSTVPKILDQYHGSMNMLYEGAILAIVVIFFFLRDWRATLIGAIALTHPWVWVSFMITSFSYFLSNKYKPCALEMYAKSHFQDRNENISTSDVLCRAFCSHGHYN